MADLSYLYQVATGQTVIAEDHNSLVRAVQAINAELGQQAAGEATYASAVGINDGGWSGVRTDAELDAAGNLRPQAEVTWADAEATLVWGTGVWDPQWKNPFVYLTQEVDLGANYHVDLAFTAHGNFIGGQPTIQVHFLPDSASNWSVLAGAQTGSTFTGIRTVLRRFRAQITVPQAGYDPATLTGFTYLARGPKFRESGAAELAVGWNTITLAKSFPAPPLILVTPEWNAEQDVRVRLRSVGTTSFQVALVLHDGTPINGKIAWEAVAR